PQQTPVFFCTCRRPARAPCRRSNEPKSIRRTASRFYQRAIYWWPTARLQNSLVAPVERKSCRSTSREPPARERPLAFELQGKHYLPALDACEGPAHRPRNAVEKSKAADASCRN